MQNVMMSLADIISTLRISLFQRPRPPETVSCIIVHWIDSAVLLIPILPHPERNQGFVRRQQGPRKRVSPVDAESGTRDLHPALNVGHGGEFAREDLAEQEFHDGHAARR